MNPSVAVAMSGGVDSSVAALLLKEAGCSVVGFTMKLWEAEDNLHSHRPCCTAEMARAAGRVCAHLGIPHWTLDLREDFQREVISKFEDDYLNGRTPNPCVLCNSRLKWGALRKKAQALGLSHIATGHYARLEPGEAGTMRLLRAADKIKDQSYFLWDIPAPTLAATIFPLGALTKQQTRELARQAGLPTANRPESQEVCFIPDNDYRRWLKQRHLGLANGDFGGDLVDMAGKKLGRHNGYPYFTIGQCKGLGLGGGRKYYVIKVDTKSRQVTLGDYNALAGSEFKVRNLNWLNPILKGTGEVFNIKIRYRDPGIPAQIDCSNEGYILVKTLTPVYAVAPGQSAVFYRGEDVVGGGIIRDEG